MNRFTKLEEIKKVISSIPRNRTIALITGYHVKNDRRLSARIQKIFSGRIIDWYTGIQSHPKIVDAVAVMETVRRWKPAIIIAIGGASVLDCAKIVAVFSTKEELGQFMKGGKLPRDQKIPMVAVPTTFGSGSEATRFAVLYDKRKKYSIDDRSLTPNIVISDPILGMTVPQHQIAAAGIDCLTEAIEALWSVCSTSKSDQYAKRALRLVLSSLHSIFCDPKNVPAQKKMAQASFLVGRAIDITRTTGPHALSYPLSIQYGIPHGVACGLTIAQFFKYNNEIRDIDCLDPRGAHFVKSRIKQIIKFVIGRRAVDSTGVTEFFTTLFKKLKLPFRLREWGIKKEAIRKLFDFGLNSERLSNNPRRTSREAIISIYENVW